MAIISMAQHASPKVTGQIDDRRAHCTIFSTVVVNTGISDSRPIQPSVRSAVSHPEPSVSVIDTKARSVAPPVEHPFAPNVHVTGEQQEHEQHDLREAA